MGHVRAGRTRALILALALALPAAGPRLARADESAPFELEAWIASLGDPPAGGDRVVYEGGEAPEPEVLALFEVGLRSEDPRSVGVVLDELEAYGVPAGEAVLLSYAASPAWHDGAPATRVGVLRALRLMRSGRALPLFARAAFAETHRPALREAVRALCESGAPEALDPLRALAGGPDPLRRNLVVRYLRRSGEADAAGEARQLRRDAKREARQERRDRGRDEGEGEP